MVYYTGHCIVYIPLKLYYIYIVEVPAYGGVLHRIMYIPLNLYFIFIVEVPAYGGVLLCTLYSVYTT